ncbi:MAG: hypothetical protein WA973_00490 [Mesorhizobium sp.]
MNQSALISAAHDDVKYVLHVLAVASAGGPKSKPTIAQLNDIVSRLENADKFLRAATPAESISDEDIRAILSCKDIASGRVAISRALGKAEA